MLSSHIVDIDGQQLECACIDTGCAGPQFVFLHEGLGSVALWRDFPQHVLAATGGSALVYSRLGYGRSQALSRPRTPDYMHAEALVTLPRVLDRFAIAAPILVGHSDGASIALIHAGEAERAVRAVIALAPHVFVESLSLASIAAAADAYRETDLRSRLSRYHEHVESAFRGWNDIWLTPAFRTWNIVPSVARITCPLLLIQGRDDEYGTLAQLDAIEEAAGMRVERLELARCGHSPHRDQPSATLEAIARFVASV
jgi:pimeloyl-ACP methyl ester carboxylesterase